MPDDFPILRLELSAGCSSPRAPVEPPACRLARMPEKARRGHGEAPYGDDRAAGRVNSPCESRTCVRHTYGPLDARAVAPLRA